MHKGLMTAAAAAALALGGAGVLRGEVVPSETDPTSGVEMEIEQTVCAQGVLVECGTIVSTRCTQWVASSGGGSVTIAPGTGSVSGTVSGSCISYVTTTTKLYKDRYVKKSA